MTEILESGSPGPRMTRKRKVMAGVSVVLLVALAVAAFVLSGHATYTDTKAKPSAVGTATSRLRPAASPAAFVRDPATASQLVSYSCASGRMLGVDGNGMVSAPDGQLFSVEYDLHTKLLTLYYDPYDTPGFILKGDGYTDMHSKRHPGTDYAISVPTTGTGHRTIVLDMRKVAPKLAGHSLGWVYECLKR